MSAIQDICKKEDEKIFQSLGISSKPWPWWRRIRKPWSFLNDRQRKRGWVGLNFRIDWLEFVWFYTSWGFGRPTLCVSLLNVGSFKALFMWDTAHVSRLGKVAKFLTPLQSILWFSFTRFTNGSGNFGQSCNQSCGQS